MLPFGTAELLRMRVWMRMLLQLQYCRFDFERLYDEQRLRSLLFLPLWSGKQFSLGTRRLLCTKRMPALRLRTLNRLHRHIA